MLQLLILSLITFLLSLLTTGWLKQRFSQNLLDIPNDVASATPQAIAVPTANPPHGGGGLGFIIALAGDRAITPHCFLGSVK